MIRRMACALVVLAIGIGIAAADTLQGRITKVDGNKITFHTFDKKTKKLGEATEYTCVTDCKVCVKKKKGGEKVEVKQGLNAKMLQKIGKKGRPAIITTNTEGQVTEILFAGGGGKKKQKDKN